MFCHNNKAFLFCLLKISQLRATKGLRLHPKSGCSRRLRLRNTEQNNKTLQKTPIYVFHYFLPLLKERFSYPDWTIVPKYPFCQILSTSRDLETTTTALRPWGPPSSNILNLNIKSMNKIKNYFF